MLCLMPIGSVLHKFWRLGFNNSPRLGLTPFEDSPDHLAAEKYGALFIESPSFSASKLAR